jgi:hypothetical protein
MSKRQLLLGLIGANIMGSLSPALFGEAFAAARAAAGQSPRCDQSRRLRRHKHHLSVQTGGHRAARHGGPGSRPDRRRQYRRD